MAKMPKQKPYRSEQDVGTPLEFIAAVESKFGKLDVDLAATQENSKCSAWITPEKDSLKVDWSEIMGNLWINPPYSDISPWAEKCSKTDLNIDERKIFLLIPASVSTNYFAEFIHDKCRVYFLRPRLKFIGHKHPYPKDLVLCVYGETPGYECWKWNETKGGNNV